jgi:hypothetical protein
VGVFYLVGGPRAWVNTVMVVLNLVGWRRRPWVRGPATAVLARLEDALAARVVPTEVA